MMLLLTLPLTMTLLHTMSLPLLPLLTLLISNTPAAALATAFALAPDLAPALASLPLSLRFRCRSLASSQYPRRPRWIFVSKFWCCVVGKSASSWPVVCSKKRKKPVLCLSQGAIGVWTWKLYQNLCLAEVSTEYRRGSSAIFLFFPLFLCSALLEYTPPLPVPRLPILALTWPALIVRIRVDLGLQPLSKLLDWPLLGYCLKPLLVVVTIWMHHDINWVRPSRFAPSHPISGSF